MGLCKCPKRKVTNLFCFEHRVNVCESCLLANHESCVVQTYLSWLTDSDYDANCLLCFEPLISKETVRLKCLHLFHWNCFDARMRQLPDTTAPAGYKCPSCLECIFPSENQQSPVVDKLRIKLQTVNWGRLGIGLPTLPELDQKTPSGHLNASSGMAEMMGGDNHILQNHIDRSQHATMPILPPVSIPSTMPNHQDPFIINESRFTARSKLLSESSNGGGSMTSSVFIGNEDDSKYMKKAQSERSFRSRLSRLPRSVKRLLLALLALALLYVLVGMLIGSPGDANIGLKQQNEEDGRGDPLFDPHANPNVRVQAGGAGRGES